MHEVAPEGFKIRKPVNRRPNIGGASSSSAQASASVAGPSTLPPPADADEPESPQPGPSTELQHQFITSTSISPTTPQDVDPSQLPGPNALWCIDHHSKLSRLGMEIIGIRDKASGKWLGLWAVPNGGPNGSEQWGARMKRTVALLYLCVCEVYGGACLVSLTTTVGIWADEKLL